MNLHEFLSYVSGTDDYGTPKCRVSAVIGMSEDHNRSFDIGKAVFTGRNIGNYFIVDLEFGQDKTSLSNLLGVLREFEEEVVENGGKITNDNALFLMFSSADYPEYGYLGTIRPAFWALTADRSGIATTTIKMSFELKDASYFDIFNENDAENDNPLPVDNTKKSDILNKNVRNEAEDDWLSE